jgi:hypothetical protein
MPERRGRKLLFWLHAILTVPLLLGIVAQATHWSTTPGVLLFTSVMMTTLFAATAWHLRSPDRRGRKLFFWLHAIVTTWFFSVTVYIAMYWSTTPLGNIGHLLIAVMMTALFAATAWHLRP